MIKRLKQLRKSLKLNQTDFASQLGITQTAYSMIENGNNPLSNRYIKLICAIFNVNETWLRTGKDDMFFSSPYKKEFTEIFNNLEPETQQYLLLMAKELLNTQKKLLKQNDKKEDIATIQLAAFGGKGVESMEINKKTLNEARNILEQLENENNGDLKT